MMNMLGRATITEGIQLVVVILLGLGVGGVVRDALGEDDAWLGDACTRTVSISPHITFTSGSPRVDQVVVSGFSYEECQGHTATLAVSDGTNNSFVVAPSWEISAPTRTVRLHQPLPLTDLHSWLVTFSSPTS